MTKRSIIVIIIFIVAAITGVNLNKFNTPSTSPILQLSFLKISCKRFLQSRCLVSRFLFGNSSIRLSVLRPTPLFDLLSHISPVLAQYLREDLLLCPSNPSSYYVLKQTMQLSNLPQMQQEYNNKPEVAIHLIVSSQMICNLRTSYAAVITV